jgi:hypothetical protein
MVFGAEAVRLAALLENAGIGVLVFKGPAVSWTLYDDPALREMTDLDLLVRPRDARRAYGLLISEGYQPDYPGIHWTFLQSHNNEAPLRRGEVVVDLHWETSPGNFRPARDHDAAWTRGRRVPVAGGAVPTFAAEDLLLFLCVHGGTHCWAQLNWLADVARLVAREPLDWDLVLSRARATGSAPALSLALALLRDLLGVSGSSPPPDTAAQRLARRIRRSLASGSSPPQLRLWLALSGSPLDKAKVFVQVFRPQIADQLWYRFPAWLSALYYITRPCRLAVKHGGNLVHAGSRRIVAAGTYNRRT